MTWWRQVRRNEASSAVCSRRHLRAATPDRRQRQHCLDVAHHGRQMQQERKQSPEGLAALLKNVRRAGRQYVKNRPRKARERARKVVTVKAKAERLKQKGY